MDECKDFLRGGDRESDCVHYWNPDVIYKRAILGRYCCDLLVEKKIVVESKAIDPPNSSPFGQSLNYPKACDFRVGLLFNFGSPRVEYRMALI